MVAIIQSSLKIRQHILLRQLAARIESNWAQYLTLHPYPIPEDLGYIEGDLSGEKLTIENKCYQTIHFRKLHLELARVGNSLDILHCVMFPRSEYELPIFGVDLIANNGNIGAAIVDLSPISLGINKLAFSYQNALENSPKIDFTQPRKLPKWGSIFSEFCLFIRPVDRTEEILFLDRVEQFLRLHCQNTLITSPVAAARQKIQIHQKQRFYCQQQQKNDKTRKVLEKALGKAWTDRYMTEMLFDCV